MSQNRGSHLEARLHTSGFRLEALETTPALLQAHESRLAAWYSDDYNRGMMDGQAMTVSDVREVFESAWKAGNRQFLLFVEGELAGDADFRGIENDAAEFAIMVGARQAQGKGLGTLFSRMVHHAGFHALKLEVVYLTVLERNVPARRCYERIGYVEDRSPAACAYIEGEEDIPLSLTRERFYEVNRGLVEAIEIGSE